METKKFKITQSAFDEIKATIGNKPAESGGLLFGSRKDFTVTRFLFDKNSINTRSSYTFNTGYLNPIIKKWWDEEELELLGFIHSHPYGLGRLSQPDKDYFASQFKNIDVEKFLTPLVFSAKDGGFKFIPLAYNKNGTVDTLELEIVTNSNEITKKKKKSTRKKKKINNYKSKTVIKINNTFKVEPKTIPLKIDEIKKETEERVHKTILDSFNFSQLYQVIFTCFLIILLGFLIVLIPVFYKYIIQQLLN
ncbi:JAB domain-containing protein [Polaribacter sp. KT25b]|uniref:Mov34/MPN/PAD-1 family protein n=1 Tax=Polaribacter sp. KT25b TaxID=1855336 RepID=UPI00087B3D11|nr:Mov34/MPN/PAD-1 family protein [Polaribacter sp. KT25b]SDR66967.1 JAB domain-containing protein [Polaribacter sp. KT25b]